MARDVQDLGDLARGIRQVFLAVSAAIPLPFAESGVVEASPGEEHLMALREIAFAAALGDRLDYEYYADPEDLAALARGELPAPREG